MAALEVARKHSSHFSSISSFSRFMQTSEEEEENIWEKKSKGICGGDLRDCGTEGGESEEPKEGAALEGYRAGESDFRGAI